MLIICHRSNTASADPTLLLFHLCNAVCLFLFTSTCTCTKPPKGSTGQQTLKQGTDTVQEFPPPRYTRGLGHTSIMSFYHAHILQRLLLQMISLCSTSASSRITHVALASSSSFNSFAIRHSSSLASVQLPYLVWHIVTSWLFLATSSFVRACWYHRCLNCCDCILTPVRVKTL